MSASPTLHFVVRHERNKSTAMETLRPRTPGGVGGPGGHGRAHSRSSSVAIIHPEAFAATDGGVRLLDDDDLAKEAQSTVRLLVNHANTDGEKGLLAVPTPQDEDKRFFIAVDRYKNLKWAALWALSLIVSCACTWAIAKQSRPEPYGSFASGYATDLSTARPALRVQQTQFHGSPDFIDRHFVIPASDPSSRYIGANEAVDAAWQALHHDRYFLLSDAEAAAAYGANHSAYWNVHHGGWVAGLDVLHTLHCLDNLRRSLYPDIYPQDPQHAVMHAAHCVDHLRQLTMCHADLTPVPTQWFDGISRNYINSSRLHTCRNFDTVREWASDRFNGSSAVKARNRDGSVREEVLVPWTP